MISDLYDGPEGQTPKDQKKDVIDCIKYRMKDLARDFYDSGASQGRSELLKMQKQAGVKNREKGFSLRDFKRAVKRRFRETWSKYDN